MANDAHDNAATDRDILERAQLAETVCIVEGCNHKVKGGYIYCLCCVTDNCEEASVEAIKAKEYFKR